MKFDFYIPPPVPKKALFTQFGKYIYRNGKKYAEWDYTDNEGRQFFRVIKK